MDKNKNLILYDIFKGFDDIIAFTTTKNTLPVKDVRYSEASENKAMLANLLELSPEQLIFPKQTHTNCVVEVFESPEETFSDTDALVTNVPGLCLCVQTADCVPVLLYDSMKKVVSAVHAGRRGTVGKIVEVAVEKMVADYDCSAENIFAVIGPSISPGVYEVGDEVVNAARNFIPNVDEALHKNDSGNYHFNLWEANRQILLKNGLSLNNVEIFGECSFSETRKYFSARREGVNTGRMVSGIMLR